MHTIAQKALSILGALSLMLTGCTTKPSDSGASQGSDTTSQITEDTSMALSQKTFAAEEQYVKMLGRTHNEEGILWLALSASGVEFTMDGTAASFTVVADNNYTNTDKQPRIAAYVDGERVVDLCLEQEETVIDIFASDIQAEHTVSIVKLSEAAESTCGIKSINVTCAGDIAPTAEKELKIEFIGDSITCGYGVDDEDRDHHFSTHTEDATKAYAYKAAQLLDADYSLVSYSGHGIVSGYTTQGKKVAAQQVPKMYTQFARSYGSYNGYCVSSSSWEFDRFVPNAVVINLGTNDASYTGSDSALQQEYSDEYVKFLKTVRENNPEAYIICTLGVMGDTLYGAVENAVAAYTEETGDTKVSAFRLTPQDGSTGFAADWHPTSATHDRAAEEIAAEIRRVLGI